MGTVVGSGLGVEVDVDNGDDGVSVAKGVSVGRSGVSVGTISVGVGLGEPNVGVTLGGIVDGVILGGICVGVSVGTGAGVLVGEGVELGRIGGTFGT